MWGACLTTGVLQPLRADQATSQPANPVSADSPSAPTAASQPSDEFEEAQPSRLDSTPPQYLNLRYDEDYFYNEFPGVASRNTLPASGCSACRTEAPPEIPENDPFQRLKNINLGGDWRLDLGGEFRIRAENRTNPLFGLDRRTSNMQQNYREMLHANLRYRNLFRVFAQGINTHVESQNGPFQPTQENHGDIQQLFGDLRLLGENVPLTLRVGRQELRYGHDRLIGAFEWVSNRRRFDAIKLFYSDSYWDVDGFYARPVLVRRESADPWNDDYNFYGIYSTFKGIPRHGIDFYFLGVDRSDIVMNPNGHEGGRSVYTVGSRFFGVTGPVDYDMEFAEQWGKWAGDEVQAIFFEADLGYTIEGPLNPRIGTGMGWGSGDKNPEDRHIQTWDQLFTYDHVCLSVQDLVGRQNVTRWYLSLDLWPTKKLQARMFYHVYWLNQETDFYYNAGGSPLFRDEFGHSGNELGSALEFLVEYRLDAHSSFLFSYSHFWDETFIHNQVEYDDDPDFFFIQYQFKF